MFDGIYYLISCRAYEVFTPRATLFAPPSPRQSTSISTREKIMTWTVLINSELHTWIHKFPPNKHDALTQCWFYVWPPSATLAQRKTSIGSRRGVCWVVICEVWFVGLGPISLYFCYAYIAACYNSLWTWKTTGPTQINSSVDGCLIPAVNLLSNRQWPDLGLMLL